MDKLRAGVIGCGFISTTAHLPALQQIEDLEVVAVADVSDANRRRAAKILDLPESSSYSSHEPLLARQDVDFVTIGVPDNLHAPLAIDAARAGKHSICEKPLAASLAEADRMIDAAESNRVKMAVFHNFLLFPEIQRVGQILRSGTLGKVRASWMYTFGDGMYIEEFYRHSTGQQQEKDELSSARGSRPWRYNLPLSSGGIWPDYGTHCVYMTTHFFGEDPLRVDAVVNRITEQDIQVEDYVHCRVEFPSGYGMIHMSRHPYAYTEGHALQSGGMGILADGGTLEFVYRAVHPKVRIRW